MAPFCSGRWVAVGFLAVVLGACVTPQPIVIGPCTLRVSFVGEPGDERDLAPPYVVELVRGEELSTGIGVSGAGWRAVDVTVTEPGGDIHDDLGQQLTADDMGSGSWGFNTGKLGTWRIRLSDDQAGCVREFSVEVVPAPAASSSFLAQARGTPPLRTFAGLSLHLA